jgi:CheY-like chemotaxis protein
MKPKVLIVDDDAALLRLMQVELGNYSDAFSVITTGSAQEALDVLKKQHIMFVVSDLRMPGMDGYDLLSQILKFYPDIPVYIVTAFDKPKTRDVVVKSGAAGYLKKPFSTDELVEAITHSLRKRSEGGSLHNVSLETFLQLIEMEQKTCTLHIIDKKGKNQGALFFRQGDLFNARVGNRQGKPAAYTILSWSNVSLSIEHDCVFKDKKIDGDLQAILLDAMRTKDEQRENDITAFDAEGDASDGALILDNPVDETAEISMQPAGATLPENLKNRSAVPERKKIKISRPGVTEPMDFSSMPADEAVRKQIEMRIGARNGIKDVSVDTDAKWESLLDEASAVGDVLDFGRLNVLCISREANEYHIVVPGRETAVVSISAESPRDRILEIFA